MRSNTTASGSIAVAVSRFGADPVALSLPEGSTVGEALSKAGITPSGAEQVFCAGQAADMSAIVEDGDVLSIVTPKAAGTR